MALDTHKITEKMMENKQVTDAPDQPQGTAQQNKYLFDRLAKEVIIPAFNALIDSLTSAGGADIGVSVPGVSGTTVKEVLSSMKTLIDDRYTKSQSDANLKTRPIRSSRVLSSTRRPVSGRLPRRTDRRSRWIRTWRRSRWM